MSVGLRLLASLMDAPGGLDQYARLRLDESLFMGEAEREAFEHVHAHVLKYGKLPSREACRDAGLTLIPGKQPEPPAYYFDKVRERHVFYRLKGMLERVEVDLNNDEPGKALGAMSDTMSLCQLFLHRDRVVDFARDGFDHVLAEYKRKLIGDDARGLRFGWPSLDATGPLSGGDVATIVGRPGMGKTYLMLHAANTAWNDGLVPLFVSMEMKPIKLMQRATAMMAHLPVTGIRQAALPTKQQALMQKTLRGLRKRDFPYWIVDGALTSSVDDVMMLARQLTPGVIFIDGAYLLRGNPRLTRWDRLTDNAERIKAEMAEGLNVPVVISYQFNREVKRNSKADSVGLDNIAYTDAIGQLSSVVLGMLQPESVETLIKRRVEILKGRDGEQGAFDINWRFDAGPDYMNFSEITATKVEGPSHAPSAELDYI
jgi:replicative DNA helicase